MWLVLLYFLIGIIIFGIGDVLSGKKMEGVVWWVAMIIFGLIWPLAIFYGIGYTIGSELKKRNDEKNKESNGEEMGVRNE